jgi:O-antigen/teichoic acid export membrane protein
MGVDTHSLLATPPPQPSPSSGEGIPAGEGTGPGASPVPGAAHFVRSTIKFGLAQPISWVSSAVLAVLLPRALGDANLGRLGFALGLTLLAGLLANLGISTYLTKEVARAPERAADLAVSALVLRLPLSVLSAGVAMALVMVRRGDPVTQAVVLMLSAGILVDATRAVVQGTLQGLHRMTTLAAFPAVSGAVYAAIAVATVARGGGVVLVAAAYVAGQTAGLAVNVVALRRVLAGARRPSLQVFRLLLVGGLPFFVWQAALVVYGQIDSVLLSYLTNDAVVGWYVAAYRVVTVPIFLPTVLMTVAFPALSAASRDPARFNTIVRRAIEVVLVVTVPMTLGVMLLPDRIIQALHWAPVFRHSILPIVLLAPSFPLVAVDMMIGSALNARDRQRQWALTGVAAAVLNPALNLMVIPYTQARFGNGAIGAAAVTTVTELFMMSAGIRLMPAGVLGRATALWALRCLVAGLAMAAVVIPLRGTFILLPVLAGAGVYVGAALALRIVSPAEVRSLLSHLRSRSAPPNETGAVA